MFYFLLHDFDRILVNIRAVVQQQLQMLVKLKKNSVLEIRFTVRMSFLKCCFWKCSSVLRNEWFQQKSMFRRSNSCLGTTVNAWQTKESHFFHKMRFIMQLWCRMLWVASVLVFFLLHDFTRSQMLLRSIGFPVTTVNAWEPEENYVFTKSDLSCNYVIWCCDLPVS